MTFRVSRFLGGIFLLPFFSLHALIDGTSTMQYFSTLQTYNSASEEARGLVWYAAGFTVDGAYTFTWNSVVPVNGTITLANSAELSLTTDLLLGADASIAGVGTISAASDGRTISITKNVTSFDDLDLIITASDTVTIDCHGGQVDFTDTTEFNIGNSATLRFRNATLNGVRDGSFLMGNNGSALLLENCTVVLAENTTISTGTLGLKDVVVKGRGYTLTSAGTSGNSQLVEVGGTVVFEAGTTFEFNREFSGTFEFTDTASVLAFNQATFSVVSGTLTLTAGTLSFDHNCSITGNVTLGDDSSSANNVNVDIAPAGLVNLLSGTLTNNNV